MKNTILVLVFILVFYYPFSVLAQTPDGDVEELNLIQLELDRNSSPPITEDEPNESTTTTRQSPGNAAENSKEKTEMTYEDLSRLSDFKQVSVIQRRFLPRTGRMQAYIGPALTLNDPWFNVMGASLKLGYNFTESLGIEGSYSFMSTDKTMALKELKKEHTITTENFVYVKNYYALAFNWTPLYGKMTWLNERIVYYDIYFNVGFGGTEIQNGDVQDTLNLGAGQIFSISKSTAFRWDLTWNFFEAKQLDATQGAYNNVFISAGFSFFFPEANYR
jgi:outer membrane beta-barrel protein